MSRSSSTRPVPIGSRVDLLRFESPARALPRGSALARCSGHPGRARTEGVVLSPGRGSCGVAPACLAALRRFEADLIDITLVDTFVDTVTRIRSDPRFARCRTLDAIHACTALLLREWTGQSVRVATFDRRLSDLAAELGLN